MTKYITKDLDRTVKESGAHLYYCSQGLKRSAVVFRGKANDGLTYDYENEYNSVKWLPKGTTAADLARYVHQYDTIESLKSKLGMPCMTGILTAIRILERYFQRHLTSLSRRCVVSALAISFELGNAKRPLGSAWWPDLHCPCSLPGACTLKLADHQGREYLRIATNKLT